MTNFCDIKETLEASKLYLDQLECLNKELEKAQFQIISTSKQTDHFIVQAFNSLLEKITKTLTERKNKLLQISTQIKTEKLTPLKECQTIILDKIEDTREMMQLGNSIITGQSFETDLFEKTSSQLGSLPEVPSLKDVPYITFDYEMNFKSELDQILKNFGTVTIMGPVQISQISEKPGGLLLQWHTVEQEEKTNEIEEFLLQRAVGKVENDNIKQSRDFVDCYKGPDTQFLVKELIRNQPYSFRICCKFEGSNRWSPWSLHQIASTKLESYTWISNEDFKIHNDKIAQPLKENPSLLFAEASYFEYGYCVEFTFLEVGNDFAAVGILPSNEISNIKDLKPSVNQGLLVNSQGEIIMDGVKRSTQLPRFTKGLKINFTSEVATNGSLMIHIDVKDKRVTYNWKNTQKFRFVAEFRSRKWKILIE